MARLRMPLVAIMIVAIMCIARSEIEYLLSFKFMIKFSACLSAKTRGASSVQSPPISNKFEMRFDSLVGSRRTGNHLQSLIESQICDFNLAKFEIPNSGSILPGQYKIAAESLQQAQFT